MSMVWRIARKEWTEWRRDGRLVLLLGCLLALLVASVAGGVLAASRVATLKAAMAATDHENFVAIEGQNPHAASHLGRVVYTPAPPLTFLDRGLLDSLGVGLRAIAHRFDGFEHAPDADRTGLAKLGNISAAGVVQALAPLVLILLLFAAFAGEREAGTLQQVAAGGAAPLRLLAGKALAGAGVVLALLTVIAAGGLVAILSTPSVSRTTQIARLAALLTAYGTYLFVWIALTLAVSARIRRSSTALAILVAAWIGAVGMAPKIMAAAAATVHPLPMLTDVRGSITRAFTENRELASTTRRQRLLRESLARYNVTRVQDLPFYFEGLVLEAREDIDAALIGQAWLPVWDVYERQAKFMTRGSAISPLLALQSLSMSLTETDVWHLRRFFDGFLDYRHQFVSALNHDLTANARFEGVPIPERFGRYADAAIVGDEWATYTPTRETWERMPSFSYAPPAAVEALQSQATALLGLGITLLITGGAAFIAVRRVEVRP